MAQDTYFGNGGYGQDTSNGLQGGYSVEALLNARRQSNVAVDSGANPFDAMLRHAIDFGPSPYTPAPTPVTPVQATPVASNGWDWLKQFQTPVVNPSPIAGAHPANNPVTNPSPLFGGGTPVPTNTLPGTPPKPPGTEDPAIAAQWYQYWIPGITPQDVSNYRISGFQGPIIDWWNAGKPGQQPFLGHPPPPNVAGGGTPTPYTPPPPVAPGPAPAPPPVAPPPATPQGTPVDSQQYLDALNRALSASQATDTQNALRSFRAAGSASGLENTGAYGTGQQEVIAGLSNDYSQKRAQAMLSASEAERQRQFTGEQNNLDRALNRFGIQLNSDTSRANAATAAGSAKLAAELSYQLGLKGIEVDQAKLAEQIRNDTLGYNLGVGQQDLTKLLAGNQNQIDLFKILASIGPEQLFAQLFGQTPVPGFQGYTP